VHQVLPTSHVLVSRIRKSCSRLSLDLLSNGHSFIIQVITNTVNVVSTIPGLYLVEKMGRRGLLLLGAIGVSTLQQDIRPY
jgi:hypothetical protein